ncbi:uncharacterized protein LOC129593523 [Paramacrobiotus metropolitanus]|uniref:uncharacterized protein LOC129593523 n=1 Tax=Paramacrobiotus metropolitanus TaxID=2943436 RepID=UPI0024464696|nr:uncharacterized protein LOC129593523 [Paramacrobiotus metropolitanus]XP_055345857.1 uncharacterized protein LOC129593523 [Paramacrobiotus metropolitanus]
MDGRRISAAVYIIEVYLLMNVWSVPSYAVASTGNAERKNTNTTATAYALPSACNDDLLAIVLPCACSVAGQLVIISCSNGLDDLLDLNQIEKLFTFWIKISLKTSASLSSESWHDKLANITHRVSRLEISDFTDLRLPLTFLGDLSNLNWLKFRDGGFGSPRIPANAFPNSNLESLSIVDSLVESIDDDAFSYNTNLYQLDLSGNPIRYIPYAALTTLRNLQTLTINHGYLSTLESNSIPSAVAFPYSLSALHLEHNQISRIPEEFLTALKQLKPGLKSLRLVSNHIRDIPASIFELPVIESIILRDNLISNFPVGLKNIRNDTDVDLSANNLSVLKPRDIPARIRKFVKPWNLRGNPLFCGNNMDWFICWLERENPTSDQSHELLCEGNGVPMLSLWNATLCRPKTQTVTVSKPILRPLNRDRLRSCVPGLQCSGSQDSVQRRHSHALLNFIFLLYFTNFIITLFR